jgi:hypothetical protein
MFRLLIALIFFFFACNNVFAATDEQDDCNYFVGPNMVADPDHDSDNWYYKNDSVGRKAVCRDSYPTSNQLLSLKRNGTDPFSTTYRVRLGYCWIRTLDGGCANSDWSTDGATFESTDVKTSTDDAGKRVLRAAGTVAHVCLKRYAPGDTMLHTEGGSTTSTSTHPKVCGYVVDSLVGNACTSPLLSWDSSWFGCVEDSLMPRPVTYNPVIPSEITPIVDTKTKLLDYVDDKGIERPGYITLGSKFDQPLIKLINSYSGLPANTLMLRYKFPGDPDVRQLNDYPTAGQFNNTGNFYQAVVSTDNPSQVCACMQGSGCDNGVYIGCVDRPTPYQSDLAILAVSPSLMPNPDGSLTPTVSPEFALTDSSHQIIYYDASNRPAYLNTTTNEAFLRNPTTLAITSIPATLPLTYKKLGLPSAPMNLREYYVQDVGGVNTYAKDVGTVYGVSFDAIIPQLDASGNPTYEYLNTPPRVDQCNVVTPPPAGYDTSTTPQYYKPGGTRSRTYCTCPSATVCPAPGAPGCLDPNVCPPTPDTCPQSTQDALKTFCPGIFTHGEVSTADKICLRSQTSSWNFVNSSTDKLCDKIKAGCVSASLSKGSGYMEWPELQGGTTMTGSCDLGLGFESGYTVTPVPYDKDYFYAYFGCPPAPAGDTAPFPTKAPTTCSEVYSTYLSNFNSMLAAFPDQSERNLSNGEVVYYINRYINPVNTAGHLDSGSPYYYGTWYGAATPPTRSCTLGIAKVTNTCKKTYGCLAIPQPYQAFGYGTFPNSNTVSSSTLVTGSCPAGYIQSAPSVRLSCIVTPANTKYWRDAGSPMCTKQ